MTNATAVTIECCLAVVSLLVVAWRVHLRRAPKNWRYRPVDLAHNIWVVQGRHCGLYWRSYAHGSQHRCKTIVDEFNWAERP